MSKSLLKKTLTKFSADQLRELIIEMYDSRKDVKEYLNFYLNPDSKAIAEKCIKPIVKEFQRSKRYDSKARISKIKAEIKYFESFSPDADYVREFYFQTVVIALVSNCRWWFSDALITSLGQNVVKKYLELSDKANVLDKGIERLLKEAEPRKRISGFAREISDIIYDYMAEKSL